MFRVGVREALVVCVFVYSSPPSPLSSCALGHVRRFTRADHFLRGFVLLPSLSLCLKQGHEYIELHHLSSAIEAYRKAVDINPKDYRCVLWILSFMCSPLLCDFHLRFISFFIDSSLMVLLGSFFLPLFFFFSSSYFSFSMKQSMVRSWTGV